MKEICLTYIVAQVIGLIAFLISLCAYHKNDKKSILNNLIIYNFLNFIHYMLLDAKSGCVTKALAIIRDTFV